LLPDYYQQRDDGITEYFVYPKAQLSLLANIVRRYFIELSHSLLLMETRTAVYSKETTLRSKDRWRDETIQRKQTSVMYQGNSNGYFIPRQHSPWLFYSLQINH
jgi:hypothetical protein